jgi:uncharacterized protein YqgC (DUF456 family)
MVPAVVVLVVVLMIAGIAGSLLPWLPGTPLILLGAFLFALATDFERVDTVRLVILAGLMLLSYVLEHLSGAFGARKLGGSRWAAAGALLGGLVGLFFGLPGVVLGPAAGAIGFELAHRKELRSGLASGLGALLGMFLGAVAKLSIAMVMVGLFAFWALRS